MRDQPSPVAFHGFDVDGSPGGAYVDLVKQNPGLDRVADETLTAEIERLRLFVETNPGEELSSEVAVLADALQYIRMVNPAATYEDMNPAMAFREQVM